MDRVDILLNVADVERSLTFYRDLMGMRLDGTWSDDEGRTRWARLTSSGGSALMLNQPGGPVLADRANRPSYRDAVLYLRVENVETLDAIHDELRESGAHPGERRDEMYGLREFIVHDPDGYELAITTPLGQ